MSEWMEQTIAYWGSGGPLLVPIAFVCFGIWAFFLRSRELLARAIRDGAIANTAIDKIGRKTATGDLDEIMATLPGGIAAMVRVAVNDVIGGAVPREAFAARESECMSMLSRDVVVLAALTAVAPLLGLLGTVAGMIQTFDAVATIGGDTGARVAEGISRALITTQFGLVVALPGVFGLARLRRMLSNTGVVIAECRSRALQTIDEETEDG